MITSKIIGMKIWSVWCYLLVAIRHRQYCCLMNCILKMVLCLRTLTAFLTLDMFTICFKETIYLWFVKELEKFFKLINTVILLKTGQYTSFTIFFAEELWKICTLFSLWDQTIKFLARESEVSQLFWIVVQLIISYHGLRKRWPQ